MEHVPTCGRFLNLKSPAQSRLRFFLKPFDLGGSSAIGYYQVS